MKADLWIAIVFGFIAMVGGGLTDVYAKKVIERVGDLKSMLYIRIVAVLIMFSLVLFYPELPKFSTTNIIYIIVLGLADFVGYWAVYKAYTKGKVSVMGAIMAPYAALSAFISYKFFGEDFTIVKTVGILIALIGIVITSLDFNELKDGFQLKDFARGLGYAVLALVIYGLFVPFYDSFLEQPGWAWLMILLDVPLLLAVFVSIKLSKQKIQKKDFTDPKWIIMSALMMGIMIIAYAAGLKFSSQTSIMAAVASSYPLSILIGGRLVLNEKLAKNQYVGIGIIVVGIIVMSLVG